MKTIRTLELARTGEWGQDGAAITRQDLAEVTETFAGRPPLTVGHIQANQREGPRYGQVLRAGLADEGNTLIGTVEFGDAANTAFLRGEYNGWSVSIPRRGKDGKRYLHHLALLGDTPPKSPGLQELDSVSYDYADGDKVETYSFGGAIKEQGDAQVTEEEAKKLEAEKKRLEEENKKLLKEKEDLEKAAANSTTVPEAKPGDAAVPPKETPADGKASGDDYSDRLARVEGELRKSRVDALMAKAGGKIPEGLRDKVKGLAVRLAGDDEAFNFSDSGKTVSGKAVELLGEILSQWPAPVKTGGGGFEYSDPAGEGKPAADWNKVAKGM
jgi:hypothetical protein